MKKKDLTLIVAVIFVSAIFSLIVTNIFISTPKNRQTQVEVVGPITADFPEADKKFFNESSINPTLVIQINENDNKNPFQKTQ